MPLTPDELRNNYFLACIVFLCPLGDYTFVNPYTGSSWEFELYDDGVPPTPNPYIKVWDVEAIGRQQPNDTTLSECSMEQIDAAKATLYPTFISKTPPRRERVAEEKDGKRLYRGAARGLASVPAVVVPGSRQRAAPKV